MVGLFHQGMAAPLQGPSLRIGTHSLHFRKVDASTFGLSNMPKAMRLKCFATDGAKMIITDANFDLICNSVEPLKPTQIVLNWVGVLMKPIRSQQLHSFDLSETHRASSRLIQAF